MIFVLFFSFFSSSAFGNSIEDDYVGIWHFDEGSSDTTANAIGGKISGQFESYVEWKDGIAGSAIRIIDGVWSPAVAGDSSPKLLYDDTETVEAWVYINKFPSSGTTYLFANDGGGGRTLGVRSDNRAIYRLSTGTWDYVLSSKKLETGKWIYLAGTYNSTHICLWINGVKDSCAPKSGNVQGNGDVQFFLSSGGDDIILDEVRLSGKNFDFEYFSRVYKEGISGELGPEWKFSTDKKNEVFTLPAKEFYVGGYCIGCTSYGPYYEEALRYYSVGTHFFYRVLIEDGKETILDYYKVNKNEGLRAVFVERIGLWGDGNWYYFFNLPESTATFQKNGQYRIELRHATINLPTSERFPYTNLSSVIDIWIAESRACDKVYPQEGRAFGPYCYAEFISERSIMLSSRMETLEVYEIEVSGLKEENVHGEIAALNPFAIESGDASDFPENYKTNSNIPVLFAGATLVSAIALASGSRIRTWVTEHGRRMEEARTRAYRQMEEDKIAYEAWQRSVALAKAGEEKAREDAERKLNEQFEKRTASLQYALANADRMYTYEQKAKELARIQKDYSDVLSTDGKAALTSQALWFAKESERLYADYKIAQVQQTLAAQQTTDNLQPATNISHNSKKTEQTSPTKKPAPSLEMKLPIKINKINYGNASGKIDKWVVENSEGLKKTSDTLGWASLGMFIAGAVLTATGAGAAVGVPLMAVAFGSGAISGGLDLAVGSARQKAGIANEDDYWRMGFAPLAFIPGFGGVGKALKQVGREAGKVLGGLVKPFVGSLGGFGKISVTLDKAKDILVIGKKIITETTTAVKNAAKDFGGKVKNTFSTGKEKLESTIKNIFRSGKSVQELPNPQRTEELLREYAKISINTAIGVLESKGFSKSEINGLKELVKAEGRGVQNIQIIIGNIVKHEKNSGNLRGALNHGKSALTYLKNGYEVKIVDEPGVDLIAKLKKGDEVVFVEVKTTPPSSGKSSDQLRRTGRFAQEYAEKNNIKNYRIEQHSVDGRVKDIVTEPIIIPKEGEIRNEIIWMGKPRVKSEPYSGEQTQSAQKNFLNKREVEQSDGKFWVSQKAHETKTLKSQVENFAHFNDMIKNLDKHGITVWKNNALPPNVMGEFTWPPSEVFFKSKTRTGEFLHELRHFGQYRSVGEDYIDILKKTPAEKQETLAKAIGSSLEVDAHKWEMQNAESFGYGVKDIKFIKKEIDRYGALFTKAMEELSQKQRESVWNILSKLENNFLKNKTFVPLLVYLKAKNSNGTGGNIDKIINKLPKPWKSWLNGIFFRMREEMMA